MKKKNENDTSSQLSIEYPRDFKIIHNKKTTFLVNPLVLSSVSEIFKEKYIKGKIPSLEVDDRLNDESFSVFFSLAHGQKVNLTLKIAYSILRIAKSWKSSVIQELVEKFLAEKPEVEVKIAETIDSFESLDLLPTANMFKGKSQLLKNMFQNDFMHSIPLKPLNALLDIAIELKIDRAVINSFLIDHFKKNPILKSDFLNALDYSILTEENVRLLLSDKRTKNNEKIKQASKHLSLQKEIPRVELSSALMPNSKKSKPLKKSKMLSLSQVNSDGPRAIRMKAPYIGIFAKISYESNCEPFKNEYIRVSTTSHDPQNFLNPTNNDDFIITTNDNRFYADQSENTKEPPQFSYPYIIFQLPISVSITSYEIRNSFKACAKEWTLYGSKNQKEWTMIDNQESEEIIEPRKSVKIDLEEKSDSFSSFKLVSTRYYIEDDAYELIVSSVEFYDNNDFSEGVFSKLKSEEKYVNVITSSNNPQLLISPRHKKVWYSANEQNQSVTFQFLKHKVQPTKYTLKSGAFWHPRSWELSGSFDGKKWFILDKKTNAMQMDRKFVPNVWKIQQDYHICKFLKITQVGQTYDGMNILCLSGIEFFGNVESDESEGKRLKHNMEVFEELRSARGFRSPRSPRAGASAPMSPVTNKILPHVTTNDNKEKSSKKDTDKKSQKENQQKDVKTKKKDVTEKKKKDESDKKKKEEADKKKKEEAEKKKKEEKEKKKKEEAKKKKDNDKSKKGKSKDSDSSDSDSKFGSSDFTASSGTAKSSDTKGKSSKKSESVSTTDVNKSEKSKDKDSNEVSIDIEVNDFISSSATLKSNETKGKSSNKGESVSTTDVTTISDSLDTDNDKKEKSEKSKDTSSVIEIDDFTSSSESSKKSSDKKDKSSKESETVTTTDITITSETTDDNKKSKKSNETSTDIDMNDFTSTSEQTKTSDTKDKSSKETESVSTIDITITSDTDDKKSKSSNGKSTSEQTKTSDTKDLSSKETESIATTDITIMSDTSDTDNKKSNETSTDIDTNDFTSTSEPAKSSDSKNKSSKETESISITAILSDTDDKKSKDKSEKDSKTSSAEIEIDDFASDSKSSKSSDKEKSAKESETVSDADVIVVSDKSDTEDNDKKKDTNDIVTDLDLNDFTSDSDSSKSSDKPTKEKVKTDESSHSESSDKEKSENNKKSSNSSDIEAIFSNSDSSASKKSKKSDDDELNKNIEVKSDDDILVISDVSSDSNKNDKKDSKSNDDVVEILDDFEDDPDAF